jgi:hypothetical protein
MPGLTADQLVLLGDDIAADPLLNDFPNNPDGNDAIARAYNREADPVYWVWRSSVTKDEYTTAVGPAGSTFNWAGNGFITRSAGEQAAWREMFGHAGAVNPAMANVRKAFADIFSGTGNAAQNRGHLTDLSRRRALRIEHLLATSGTGTEALPATMGHEGPIDYDDVEAARATTATRAA